MKYLVLSLLLTLSLASSAQTGHSYHRTAQQHATATQPVASPKVYVCGGLNRCSHGVSAVTVAEAESMGRRPCKKCY
jgi:hypothetical protein